MKCAFSIHIIFSFFRFGKVLAALGRLAYLLIQSINAYSWKHHIPTFHPVFRFAIQREGGRASIVRRLSLCHYQYHGSNLNMRFIILYSLLLTLTDYSYALTESYWLTGRWRWLVQRRI